jgi:hypothetical protein
VSFAAVREPAVPGKTKATTRKSKKTSELGGTRDMLVPLILGLNTSIPALTR